MHYLLNDVLGTRELENEKIIQNMPSYPQNGNTIELNGTIIINSTFPPTNLT